MSSLKLFVIALILVFGAPWVFLIAKPFAKFKAADSAQYDLKADEMEGQFPPARRGQALRGAEVYASNGCAYCHTQMIRPTYAGSDMWRPGWAGREEDKLARATLPQDFAGENYAFLGSMRLGSDLSNLGWRTTEKEIYHALFSPQDESEQSVMPAYHNLFHIREIQGQRSDEALDVKLDCEDAENWEVVPTDDAKALAAYLMSMKKDYKVPAALSGGLLVPKGSDN